MKLLALALVLAAPAAWALPVPAALPGPDFAPMALNSFSATPPRLISAPVMDEHGQLVGHVRAVQADENGTPAAISVVPPSNQGLMVLAAAAVSYDAPKNIVITSAMTAPRLAQN